MDNTSGFFVSIPADAVTVTDKMELISGHPDGYYELYKYDKGGRFRTLKCLQPSFRGNPLYENLLRKEFEIGYSLSHNHICEYYEWVNHPTLGSCIEMEWVDGRTLDCMLAENRHPREVYDKIVSEICEALGYMHSKQVLHKDLKPSNIMITFNGNNVKIIDFGLSDSDSSSVLKISAGTTAFAAPEVLKGGKASVRSDLYSLGRVLSLFPVRKYAPVIRRLCALNPDKRPGSVHETTVLLKHTNSILPGILFILMAVALTIWMLVNPFRTSDRPEGGSIVPADTTVSIMPDAGEPEMPKETSSGPVIRKTPPAKPSEPDNTQTATTVDPSLFDDVFRQATGMFEE